MLRAYSVTIGECLAPFLKLLHGKQMQNVEMHSALERLTLDIIGHIGFETDFAAQKVSQHLSAGLCLCYTSTSSALSHLSLRCCGGNAGRRQKSFLPGGHCSTGRGFPSPLPTQDRVENP